MEELVVNKWTLSNNTTNADSLRKHKTYFTKGANFLTKFKNIENLENLFRTELLFRKINQQ